MRPSLALSQVLGRSLGRRVVSLAAMLCPDRPHSQPSGSSGRAVCSRGYRYKQLQSLVFTSTSYPLSQPRQGMANHQRLLSEAQARETGQPLTERMTNAPEKKELIDKWMNLSQGFNCYREKPPNQTIYISQKSSSWISTEKNRLAKSFKEGSYLETCSKNKWH